MPLKTFFLILLLLPLLFIEEAHSFTIIFDADGQLLNDNLPSKIENGVNTQKSNVLENGKDGGKYKYSFSFLFPYSKKLLIGPSISVNRYTYETVNQLSLEYKVYTLSFSSMYYVFGQSDNGLFLRGDLGVATAQAYTNNPVIKADFPDERGSLRLKGSSLSFTAGTGYSYMFNNWFGMDLHMKYQYMKTRFGATSWSAAGLGFRFVIE